ncbi:MAG: hypothetical protein JSW26_13205 [Desulfobacterales bacterium]|nr:MAG: hypothetical protein JSW26_13205 [Desulfobacterales bacterium]
MSVPALFFVILVCVAIAFFIVWLIYSRRYQRASKETAFVRTGFGGQKVVMNGGALVFPVLHEVIQVNMNTIRLVVTRANQQALITKDRLRMDVQAEFYVRVKPTLDDISAAAQTLGRRTMNPDALKELVEGKFVNALRAVAAEMNMDDLHQNRGEFVQRVQESVGEGLSKNGLELESVSLSELEQTDRKYFNPDNAFDAQGLTLLTEMIQARAKQRNAIERDTEVAIRQKDLEAERRKLELAKEEEFSKLEQQREIAVRRAEQNANVVKEQVEKERQAREAEIAAKQQVELAQLGFERSVEQERIAKNQFLKEAEIDSAHSLQIAQTKTEQLSEETRIQAQQKVDQARIAAEKILEEERIAKEQLLKEKEIARAKALESAEIEKDRLLRETRIESELQLDQARIAAEKLVEAERIAKELLIKQKDLERTKALEIEEVERKKSIELADMDRVIALEEKTKEHTAAQAEVDKTRALAVKAEEQVVTARQIEIAERQKAVEILEARKKAEREAIGVKEAAEARMKASMSEAETVKIVAGGEADKIRKIAEAEAEAELVRTKAAEKRYKVEAEGTQALHEAENVLDPAKSAARIKMAIIEHLAEIIRESVKPIESIDGIKIFQVEGLTPYSGPGNGAESPAGGGSLADQLINSALRYRGQAPLIDAILKEIGIAGGDLKGLTQALKTEPEEPPEEK